MECKFTYIFYSCKSEFKKNEIFIKTSFYVTLNAKNLLKPLIINANMNLILYFRQHFVHKTLL